MSCQKYFSLFLLIMKIVYSVQECETILDYEIGENDENIALICSNYSMEEDGAIETKLINRHILPLDYPNRFLYPPFGGNDYIQWVVEITIKDSLIPIIYNGIFNGFSVKRIDLQENHIQQIEAKAFTNVKNLETLYLQNNYLNTIARSTFYGLVHLQTLDLSHNNISSLDETIFDDLENLISLDISYNNLRNLHSNLIKYTPSLHTLFATHNFLTEFTLTNLTTIKSLNLSHNNISKINESAFLQLAGDVILEKNKLKTIPIVNLNVNHLDLSFNEIKTISVISFQNKTALQILELDNNFLNDLHVDLFENLVNLITLALENNSIKRIPVGLFRNLLSLEELCLQNNQISQLHYGSFTGLTQLKILDLKNNRLYRLNFMMLFPLRNLDTLSIDNNFLKEFNVLGVIDHFHKFSLSLSGNNWECDWLAKTIGQLQKHGFHVLHGEFSKGSNIYFNKCTYNNTHLSSVDYENMQTTTATPNTSEKTIFTETIQSLNLTSTPTPNAFKETIFTETIQSLHSTSTRIPNTYEKPMHTETIQSLNLSVTALTQKLQENITSVASMFNLLIILNIFCIILILLLILMIYNKFYKNALNERKSSCRLELLPTTESIN